MSSTQISTLNTVSFTDNFESKVQSSALNAIENGELLYFPNLPFQLEYQEEFLLSPNTLSGKSKNISLGLNNKIKGSCLVGNHHQILTDMMIRFKSYATQFLNNLIPYYQNSLIMGRTSFRPAEILGRETSIRKDDTRLHVDAFPATPNQGKRILRVFSNINAEERSRIWNVGESFETVVKRFAPTFRKPFVGKNRLLSLLKVTKTYRTLYDHYMLQLHDNMKFDEDYQKNVDKLELHFEAGSTWVVMTDIVSHAALTGQHMLEQTFYLPVNAMQNPELSPLKVLERHLGQKLV